MRHIRKGISHCVTDRCFGNREEGPEPRLNLSEEKNVHTADQFGSNDSGGVGQMKYEFKSKETGELEDERKK